MVRKPTLVIWPWTSQAGCGHDYVYKPPTWGVMPRSVGLCQPALLYIQGSTALYWIWRGVDAGTAVTNRLPERGWFYMLSRAEAIMTINHVNIFVTKTNSLDELYKWSCTWSIIIVETSNIDCFTNRMFLSDNLYFSIKTTYDREA